MNNDNSDATSGGVPELSAAEKEAWADLQRAATAAKRKAEYRMKKQLEEGRRGAGKKPAVSPEEFTRRLHVSLEQDKMLVKLAETERMENSIAEWKKTVGERFAEADTDSPVILDRVRRLSAGSGTHKTSLVLRGGAGSGKTWLAYAYISKAIKNRAVTNGQIMFGNEMSILSAPASGGYKKVTMLEELFNDRYKIYFIDNVGMGYFSNDNVRREVWYALIDHVYSKQLTLILTTGMDFSMNGLGNWIGSATFDRLAHLVGPDGVLETTGRNSREEIFKERERSYQEKINGKRPENNSMVTALNNNSAPAGPTIPLDESGLAVFMANYPMPRLIDFLTEENRMKVPAGLPLFDEITLGEVIHEVHNKRLGSLPEHKNAIYGILGRKLQATEIIQMNKHLKDNLVKLSGALGDAVFH